MSRLRSSPLIGGLSSRLVKYYTFATEDLLNIVRFLSRLREMCRTGRSVAIARQRAYQPCFPKISSALWMQSCQTLTFAFCKVDCEYKRGMLLTCQALAVPIDRKQHYIASESGCNRLGRLGPIAEWDIPLGDLASEEEFGQAGRDTRSHQGNYRIYFLVRHYNNSHRCKLFWFVPCWKYILNIFQIITEFTR